MSDDEDRAPRVETRAPAVVWGVAASVVGVAVRGAAPALLLSELALAAGRRLVRPADRMISAAADRGELVRAEALVRTERILRGLIRRGVEFAVTMIDLTELVARHVDLDEIAGGIDVDAVVARVDLDAVLARVDIDGVVAQVDLPAILERVPLDEVVARVDLDAVVSRIDLDAIAGRLDLDAVIARVDVEAALARLDLPGIARQVIDSVDLPEILRQSTGTVASEAVREVRVEGVSADDAVERFVGRVLRRQRAGRPVPP